jgi:hypothetical protein
MHYQTFLFGCMFMHIVAMLFKAINRIMVGKIIWHRALKNYYLTHLFFVEILPWQLQALLEDIMISMVKIISTETRTSTNFLDIY